MTTPIPTRAEALAALDRIDLATREWSDNVPPFAGDLATIREALSGLIEPVATHRFWRAGLLEWEECACSAPAHEHEDWYPLQWH